MRHYKILKTILLTLLFCLPMLACGGKVTEAPAEVLVPTESVITDESSTSSETDINSGTNQTHGTPVIEISQIEGVWIASANPEIFYLQIHPDGTVKYAPSLFDLERGSTNTWMFKIEEEKIIADDFDLCPDEAGSYFGVIKNDGTLKLTSIFEPCASRLRHLDHSLPGRLFEYNLVYSPVE